MSSFNPADGYAKFLRLQRVTGLCNNGIPNIQKLMQLGLIGKEEDLTADHDDDIDWDLCHTRCDIKRSSERITHMVLKNGQFFKVDPCDFMESSDDDWVDDISKEERINQILHEEERIKQKAEKKRLKKQRQRERKRLQKEQTPTQKDKEDMATLDKAEGKPCDDKTKESLNLKDVAAALDSEWTDCSSDGEEQEGLDYESSFVSKAAEIAKRQLEQKQETKEKKKSPVKEEEKIPEKSNSDDRQIEKKDTYVPKMEDFKKRSSELAWIANKLASAKDYKLAVNYFTEAIKFNPTEYRLFGNRAFCLEKMQEFDKALNDAELSLSMSPGWVKGLFRKGRALAGLKRYEEAGNAFKEVIKLDPSCSEASHELMRTQILQLMGYGFTEDQCSKALIMHGSVEKALEVLSKLKNQSGVPPVAPVSVQQVFNVTGLSPILSAKMAAATLPLAQDASKTPPQPLISAQSHQTQAKPEDPPPFKPYYGVKAPELFPVWVGNLSFSATEPLLENLFKKVGKVYSMKLLQAKRCAFVNFTQQEHCEAAIRRYHGYELLGSKLAVRYPDRIPFGMNISKSAQISADLQRY